MERHAIEGPQSPRYPSQRDDLDERNSEKVIVAYWYEVGDYTMYERQDLLRTQWAHVRQEQMAGHVQSAVGDAGRRLRRSRRPKS